MDSQSKNLTKLPPDYIKIASWVVLITAIILMIFSLFIIITGGIMHAQGKGAVSGVIIAVAAINLILSLIITTMLFNQDRLTQTAMRILAIFTGIFLLFTISVILPVGIYAKTTSQNIVSAAGDPDECLENPTLSIFDFAYKTSQQECSQGLDKCPCFEDGSCLSEFSKEINVISKFEGEFGCSGVCTPNPTLEEAHIEEDTCAEPLADYISEKADVYLSLAVVGAFLELLLGSAFGFLTLKIERQPESGGVKPNALRNVQSRPIASPGTKKLPQHVPHETQVTFNTEQDELPTDRRYQNANIVFPRNVDTGKNVYEGTFVNPHASPPALGHARRQSKVQSPVKSHPRPINQNELKNLTKGKLPNTPEKPMTPSQFNIDESPDIAIVSNNSPNVGEFHLSESDEENEDGSENGMSPALGDDNKSVLNKSSISSCNPIKNPFAAPTRIHKPAYAVSQTLFVARPNNEADKTQNTIATSVAHDAVY